MPDPNLHQTSIPRRFIKFVLVGGTGLIVNSALLAIFTELADLYYLLSAVLATQGSSFWNFSLSDLWVFPDPEKRRIYPVRLGSFMLMNNLALLARGPILAFLTTGLGVHYLISNLISIGFITILRFAISEKWIWKMGSLHTQKQRYTYDVHGLVQIESDTRLPELESFLTASPVDAPDLRIQADSAAGPLPHGPAVIQYDEGLGDRGFWLWIEQGPTTGIRVSPILKNSPHVLYTNVVEPILRWTLVRKGYALVHGACLSNKGQGILVTARTDTGKTTTILKALSHYPFEFLSDDMVVLGKDGTMYGYPKPLTISRHTLRAVDQDTLTFREKMALQLQSRIHSRSGRWIGLLIAKLNLPAATLNAFIQMLIPPPKYSIDRLLPSVQTVSQSKLCYVALIERGNFVEELLPQESIVEILVRNSEDAYGFPPYPRLASQLMTWEGVNLQEVEIEIIRAAVTAIPAVQLRRPDYDWWMRLPAVYYGRAFPKTNNPISSQYPTVPNPRPRENSK